MADEKEIRKAERKVLSTSLKIAKEKQRLAGECFKILKLAAIKTEQKINDKRTADKVYKEIKEIDNERIKKLFELESEEKKKVEDNLIM